MKAKALCHEYITFTNNNYAHNTKETAAQGIKRVS